MVSIAWWVGFSDNRGSRWRGGVEHVNQWIVFLLECEEQVSPHLWPFLQFWGREYLVPPFPFIESCLFVPAFCMPLARLAQWKPGGTMSHSKLTPLSRMTSSISSEPSLSGMCFLGAKPAHLSRNQGQISTYHLFAGPVFHGFCEGGVGVNVAHDHDVVSCDLFLSEQGIF